MCDCFSVDVGLTPITSMKSSLSELSGKTRLPVAGLGLWPPSPRGAGIPPDTDDDDVRLSLHVYCQPRGVGRRPRCYRRAHGSRRDRRQGCGRRVRFHAGQDFRCAHHEELSRGCVSPPLPYARPSRGFPSRDAPPRAPNRRRVGRFCCPRARRSSSRVDPPRRASSARARWPEKAKSPAALSLSRGESYPRSPALPDPLADLFRSLLLPSPLSFPRRRDAPRCGCSQDRHRRPRRAGGGGGREIHRVHPPRHPPRPRPHLRVPRAPRHSHRSQGAQGSPQEGSQVPRAGLRRERVEPREEEEPQVSVTRVVGVEGE